jgi:hypothetical protein
MASTLSEIRFSIYQDIPYHLAPSEWAPCCKVIRHSLRNMLLLGNRNSHYRTNLTVFCDVALCSLLMFTEIPKLNTAPLLGRRSQELATGPNHDPAEKFHSLKLRFRPVLILFFLLPLCFQVVSNFKIFREKKNEERKLCTIFPSCYFCCPSHSPWLRLEIMNLTFVWLPFS